MKVNQGFSVSKLSLKHDISVDKLYKYNDITSEEMLDTGMFFYIEKKQNEADVPFHITEIGQSMFWIAQYYGIKLAKLYSFNKMEKYMQPAVGEKIFLQEEREDLPKVRTFYEVIVERNKLVEIEKQAELKRRAGADKALIEQRYRLQIEDLKSKNKDDEIKMSDMSYQILKLKEEQEKFQKNREDRRREIEKLEKKKNEEIKINDWKTPTDTTNLDRTDGPSYKPVTRENPKTGTVYHVVEKGETLFKLSKKYNTTVEKIKAANGLGDHGISLGQELIIERY